MNVANVFEPLTKVTVIVYMRPAVNASKRGRVIIAPDAEGEPAGITVEVTVVPRSSFTLSMIGVDGVVVHAVVLMVYITFSSVDCTGTPVA